MRTEPAAAAKTEPDRRAAAAAGTRTRLPHRPRLRRRRPSTEPFDLDDVVLAWAAILPDLPMATRSAVQQAQPIRVDGDVVVFGVAPPHCSVRRRTAVQERRPTRSATRSRRQLGRTPKFKLVASDDVDLAGRRADAAAVATTTRRAPPGDDEPARGRAVDDVSTEDLVDAEPAGPAVSSVGLLEAEFGATVVEERPRE